MLWHLSKETKLPQSPPRKKRSYRTGCLGLGGSGIYKKNGERQNGPFFPADPSPHLPRILTPRSDSAEAAITAAAKVREPRRLGSTFLSEGPSRGSATLGGSARSSVRAKGFFLGGEPRRKHTVDGCDIRFAAPKKSWFMLIPLQIPTNNGVSWLLRWCRISSIHSGCPILGWK